MKNYPNDGQRFAAWYLRCIHDCFPKNCMTKDMP